MFSLTSCLFCFLSSPSCFHDNRSVRTSRWISEPSNAPPTTAVLFEGSTMTGSPICMLTVRTSSFFILFAPFKFELTLRNVLSQDNLMGLEFFPVYFKSVYHFWHTALNSTQDPTLSAFVIIRIFSLYSQMVFMCRFLEHFYLRCMVSIERWSFYAGGH